MSKMITPIPLSKVPKIEYPELINTVVRIVNEYGAETMFVKDTADALKDRLPQLEFLKVSERKHPESDAITALNLKRRNIVAAMVRQTKAVQKANLSSQTAQLKVVVPFIEKYWSNYRNYNEKAINSRMKQMLADIDTNEEIKLAIETVGLSMYLNEIRTIETSLHNSREKRRKSKSTVQKVDVKKVKSYVGETLTDLVNAIELARKAHPELDYMPMINEINNVFITCQSGIKAHSTWVKKANAAAVQNTKPAESAA